MEVIGRRSTRHFNRTQNDHDLVKNAVEGCQDAYAVLLNRYRQAIFKMLLLRVKNPDDAHDLTMETFEKAFFKLSSYSPTHAFGTWLFKIANNHCIDHARKKRVPIVQMNDTRMSANFDGDSWLENRRDESLNPEETLIRAQRIALTKRLLSRLDVRYRRMIELRYYEEKSYEEIAQDLSMPIGTVKAQLFRAKESLHKMLALTG